VIYFFLLLFCFLEGGENCETAGRKTGLTMESKTQSAQLRCLSLSMMSPILKKTINGKKLGGVDSQRVVSPPTQGI